MIGAKFDRQMASNGKVVENVKLETRVSINNIHQIDQEL